MIHKIRVPFANGEVFTAEDLVMHIAKTSDRAYIIQGQQAVSLASHSKPHSLDVWLRKQFPKYQDTKLADNTVLNSLVATGLFEISPDLRCPDSDRLCKGLRLSRKGLDYIWSVTNDIG